MTRIAIVDYGMGNLESVRNALAFLGYDAAVSCDAEEIAAADGYILPGVGAYGLAIENLRKRNLIGVLNDVVLVRKKPILGICLGMQLMAQSSSEMGFHVGLGWMNAEVTHIEPRMNLKVPHVGWNDVRIGMDNVLFRNLPSNTHFYFDHSYHVVCGADTIAATCIYGSPLVAAIQQDNICATQFHPEKSQTAGLRLLRNFLNFVEMRKC